MTAHPIALVVADIDAGRVVNVLGQGEQAFFGVCLADAQEGVVIDVTPVYESLVAKDDPVYLYEDHPCIAPPWMAARIAYVNEHGNVVLMAASVTELADEYREQTATTWARTATALQADGTPYSTPPPHPIEWEHVRWIIDTTVWGGGRSPSQNGPVATFGPAHLWRFAVYDNGTPADMRWIHLLPDYPMQGWDMAHLVLLGALNFCACSNIEVVEPQRPRPERRRLERTGVRVHTLTVHPRGKRTRTAKGEPVGGTPLHSVRGHFATYGQGDRGLLFGKYAGRFWVPAHARGNPEHGRIDKDYVLDPTEETTP